MSPSLKQSIVYKFPRVCFRDFFLFSVEGVGGGGGLDTVSCLTFTYTLRLAITLPNDPYNAFQMIKQLAYIRTTKLTVICFLFSKMLTFMLIHCNNLKVSSQLNFGRGLGQFSLIQVIVLQRF